MNSSEKLRIHELILKSMDNQISPEEFSELNRLLASNPESRRYYGEVVDEYRTLYECTAILSSQTPAMEPVLQDCLWQSLAENERNADTVIPDPAVLPHLISKEETVESVRPQINKFSLYTAIISIAALVLLLTYVQWNSQNRSVCGTIARSVDAKWFADSDQMNDGASFYSGPIILEKGLAELVFSSGARVILQGPIQLNIESPTRLFLDRGSIAVSYENGNKQFIVRTPNSCVVDFGTEFGVSVTPSGNTETHVKQGLVELRDGTNPSRFKQSLKLLASQAGRSENDGTLKEVKYEKTKFVYKNEFDTRIKAKEGSSYYRWLAYSYQLSREPDLVLYYPCMQSEMSGQVLTNAASLTAGGLEGVFGGTFGRSRFAAPAWVEGRWPQKGALKFDRAKRTCIAVSHSPALNIDGDITLAVWVRCPDAQKGGHIISRRQNEQVNYQFGCFAAEDLFFPRKMQLLRKADEDVSVYSSRLYDWTGDWTLLVATQNAEMTRFYVNGKLYESQPFAYKPLSISATLFIGDVPLIEDKGAFGYAAFNGLMDEIAIFKRALSADEIRAMYEAGRP